MPLKYVFVWLHVSASQGHLQATHCDGTYCTVLAYVNNTRFYYYYCSTALCWVLDAFFSVS
jgi:hypothetical protein